jgi:hypothetical protein
MVKSEEYSLRKIEDIIKSFQFIETVGYAGNEIDTKPVLPDWNEETRAFYDELTGDGEMLWGTHVLKAITTEGMSAEVQSLEKKLDYKFGLVMGYCYLSAEPPVEGLREAYDAGKITELTLQIATYNNQGLDSARNPNFDVLDGKSDELIKNYAKSLKEFGHPVLLRLNNEMNTDWTSYSGMAALGDPEIYKQVHTRVFNIFREEGVDNVIWIFNPQFGDYPPANWNNYMCYYPGNGQIQVLGITGYNTGEYYKDLYGDKWKSFNEIYSACSEEYQNSFSQVPWIITEFASASNGGDKAAWIRNMFYFMPEYKNIKAAVWFSHHDMDERPGKEAVISRFYNIDETENTLRAFKDGLHGKIPEKPLSETGGGSAQR